MSKRRARLSVSEQPEALTSEERRAKRRRERAHRKAGSAAESKNPYRRAAAIGIPIAVLSAVVLFLVLSNLPTPCINFQAIPASSGVPAFPARTQTDFSRSWCPGAQTVYQIAPRLSIVINGASVAFPTTIGRNSSYPNNYACNLPILTEPPSPPQYPDGSILIISAWNYRYNLSTFFSVWGESNSSVKVGGTSAQIIYQSDNLLGYKSNATKTVQQFVDNQPSNAGPLLDLTTLDYASNPYPSCLGTLFGTGHTILLTFANATAKGAFRSIGMAPIDSTAPANPLAPLLLFDGPLPHFGFLGPLEKALSKVAHASIAWLYFRGTPV